MLNRNSLPEPVSPVIRIDGRPRFSTSSVRFWLFQNAAYALEDAVDRKQGRIAWKAKTRALSISPSFQRVWARSEKVWDVDEREVSGSPFRPSTKKFDRANSDSAS